MLVWLAAGKFTQAQVTLALQVPPTGVMLKSQLWNMALMNTGNSTINVSVELTLLSTKDNQPVMRAVSRTLQLNKGTNQINGKDVAPVVYDYLSPLFNIDRDPNGFLPVGSYKACYTVLQLSHGDAPLIEDCLPVEVQPVSPPQLNTPADTSTLETAYPQFSWLPPLPLNLFSDLTYDMLVVEVLPGQGSYEAIQQNIPVYNISRCKDQAHLYPASNTPLDTGRVYAWRVIAKNEDEFIAQSEVWTFRLASRRPAIIIPLNGSYIPLRTDNEPAVGAETITGNILGIKYYSFDKDHEAICNFLNSEGRIVRSVRQRIVYGNNFIGFTLDGSFQKGKIYKVEIVDLHNIRHTTSFTIKKQN